MGGGAGFKRGAGIAACAETTVKLQKNIEKRSVIKPKNGLVFVILDSHKRRITFTMKVKKRCLEPMSITTLSPDNNFGRTQPPCERQI
jgi:hypothetical protein